MTLLELDHVTKSHGRGISSRAVLTDVSLTLDAGELVAIWGRRRSGRSTLMRVAAGIEPPDDGVVRIDGYELRDGGRDEARSAIALCHGSLRQTEGRTVLEQLLVDQLARGVRRTKARSRAHAALARTGATDCAPRRPAELDAAEAVRVAIARALAGEPRAIVVDEPTVGVDLLARDGILALLRSLADEGYAVLASTGEVSGLSGADRAFALDGGCLRGPAAAPLADVVPLRRPA